MDLCTVTRLSAGAARRELARRVVDQGWTLAAAAEAAGVSVRCARKWVGRYRAGDRQVLDRSSAPRRVANRTCPERVAVIVKLRRLRMTAAEIAETLAMPLSTVAGILTPVGMGWLGRLGLEQPARYERSRPGELVHVDVKKLGPDRARRRQALARRQAPALHRQLHRCDRPPPQSRRLGVRPRRYAEVLPDEKATTAIGFLRRAVGFYRRYGIRVERLLTDNGSA